VGKQRKLTKSKRKSFMKRKLRKKIKRKLKKNSYPKSLDGYLRWIKILEYDLKEKNSELLQLKKQYDDPSKWRKNLQADAKLKDETISKLQKDFDDRSKWAKNLEADAKLKDETISKLQKDFDERSKWSEELEKIAKQKGDTIKKLLKQFDERSEWTKKLDSEAKIKDEKLSKLQKQFDERTEWAKKLDSEGKIKDEKILQFQEETTNLKKALDTRTSELENIQNELFERNFELEEIKKSIIFGILKKITGRLEKDFPKDSKRGETLRLAREAYIIKKERGVKALLSAFKGKHREKKLFQKKNSKEKKTSMSSNLQLLDEKQTKNFVITASENKYSPDDSLRKFLQMDSANVINISSFPKVSIIITTLNQVELLKKNLASIKSKSTYKNYEIIIVTNNTDPNSEMRKFLETVDCSVYIYDKDYLFADMNNFGASKSSGEFLLFLNDDVEIVSPNWLEAFLSLALKENVGAVGGKLLYSNGKLQEAGCIVWKNGNAWNYGKNSNPQDPKFNYVREVDYCSGSCLFVNKKIFEQAGKFDTMYDPAYCEDVDLCFSIRKLGLSVLYQPLASIIHHEGITQGISVEEGIKSYQSVNQKKFFNKWKQVLESHLDDSPENSFFDRNRKHGLNILYIDHYLPEPDKDSGSLRTFNILGILANDKNKITFWPDNLHLSQPYTTELQQKGIEVIYGPNDFSKFLDERKDLFDIVILSRPYIAIKYIDYIKTKMSNCQIIYDTIDLHFLRMKREALIEKNSFNENEIKSMHDMELELMEKSNLTILTSLAEQKILHGENNSLKFAILSNIHIIKENSTDFASRKNLMFLGGFQHHPNIDAANYLANS